MGDNALFVLPASGEIRFSQVRDMYDQGNGTSLGFKKYYRSIDTIGIVNSDTYTTDGSNTMGNTAGDNIPTGATRTATTPLKLSQFRGAFKEHIVSVGDNESTYTINPSTTEHRTYRYKFSGSIYHSSSGYTSGTGNPGINLDVSNEKVRVIIHLTTTGMISGGPGAGGVRGLGGAGGISATAGSANSGNAGTDGTDGSAGTAGSPGGKGGDCLYITNYPTANPLSQYSESTGRLKPGGGGGGGSGGGGGGGAGSSGGGGGKGAQGYNTAHVKQYNQNFPNSSYFWRIADSFYDNNTFDWQVRWNETLIYDVYERVGNLSSVVYNGVTYTRGNAQTDYNYGGDSEYTFYEITNTDVRTYYNGSDGTAGRRGTNGAKGSDGVAGRIGAYRDLNGDQLNTTSRPGYTPSVTTNGSVVEAGYATPPTGYSCNPGTGGRGTNGAKGGNGGGYDENGAGGTFGSPGIKGGDGQGGYAGQNITGPAGSGTTNGCGGGPASGGGNIAASTYGGGTIAGGAGGAAGNLTGGTTTGITISVTNWS